MPQKTFKSQANITRALKQKLESLRGAGISHIPKAKAAERKAAVKASPAVMGEAKNSGPATASMLEPHASQHAYPAGRESMPPPPPTPERLAASRKEEPQTLSLSSVLPAPCASREEALAEVAKRVAVCTRCPVLVQNRTQTVFGVGNPLARLVFVGEAPGADEDRQGKPFVGRAGQLLTDIITKGMKLRREDVYIMNILRCRPPENRTPLPAEAANCREYLDAQLAIIQPQFLCCLGACAAQNLLQVDTPIGKLRGRTIDFKGMKVLCTYHPAYVLRNPPAKRQVWDDIQILMAEMGMK
ncbi:MAG: uracil-DNA glycosylase [Thermoguttaceae bacterium]